LCGSRALGAIDYERGSLDRRLVVSPSGHSVLRAVLRARAWRPVSHL
jgi:hypothetical protein